MKKTLLLISLVFCTLLTQAQTGRTFIVKNSTDGLSELHVSLPRFPSGKAIVACPGGAYGGLSFDKEGTDWAPFFNERGVAYCTLKYRLPNGHPDVPVTDACHAIPVISIDERLGHQGSTRRFLGEQKNDPVMIERYSAERHVDHFSTPPALLLLSNDDRVVPPVSNAIAYYTAMRKAGNECTMHIYPSGDHGWGYASWFKHHEQMLADLDYWLKNHRAQPKQEAVRVACLGNSITRGSCINMASIHGYPAQLQKLLGNSYRVRNFGMPGYTMLRQGDFPYMSSKAWQMDAMLQIYDSTVDPALEVRRITIAVCEIEDESFAGRESERQLDLFSDFSGEEEDRAEEDALQSERRRQKAVLDIKKKYGKNAILKGTSLEKGATARERNRQIGGHKA